MDHPVAQLDRGGWAEDNPSRCPCRGSGWLGSDFDTWHRCPIHGDGVPHPEDDSYFDLSAHLLACLRRAWVVFRRRSGMLPADFRATCEARLPSNEPWTPEAWVDAADAVATDAIGAHDEEDALRRGYSCALEARWADEGGREEIR